MRIHLIPELGALLIVVRRGGQVLAVGVDPGQPARLINALARPVLWEAERKELAQALRTH
jgi:hypothetical protein